MHFKLVAAAIMTGALFFIPSRADAACCGQTPAPCCDQAKKPCCDKPGHVHGTSAIDMPSQEVQLAPEPPARQTTEVWFMRPTWIGKTIVQGRYVIEHDNDRMARGEPCTHIYAFNDQETPVAAFHCVHLERDNVKKNTVVVVTMPDGMQKLTEFQFAGESAGHGYPTER